MFSKIWTKQSTKESFNKIEQLKEKIEEADTIIIGREQDFLLQQDSLIPATDSQNVSLIFRKNTDFRICILEDFIHLKASKNTGHTGADTLEKLDG